MSRAYNFSAGPAALPEPVLRQAQAELPEWDGVSASVMEISHRGKAFMAMAAQAEQDLRDLLAVPPGYKVLFLQGGATQQFPLIPLNFARRDQSADYVLTGDWSEKAAREAKSLVHVRVAASSESTRYDRPHIAEVRASGDLNGTMRWTLTPKDRGTQIDFAEDVTTGKRLLNALAPIAKPFFAWNHTIMMKHGQAGLRAELARRANGGQTASS